MDLFSLIGALNPTKVKTETHHRAAHEVPLLTTTASRVIDMEDTAVVSGSLGTPSALEKSSLDFADESREGSSCHGPSMNKRHHKREKDKAKANALPKVLRKDHATFRPTQSTIRGKSLALLGLDAGSTREITCSNRVRCGLHRRHTYYIRCSYRCKTSKFAIICEIATHLERDIAQSSKKTATKIPSRIVATTKVHGMFSAESPESEKLTFFSSGDGSSGGIYQLGALNPTKVKTRTHHRAAHEVPLLTTTASCIIDMEDTAIASGSSRTPSALEKLLLDFADEDPPKIIT
nr:hypothetical protein [Tanacetum cinerariifolium]